MGSSWRRPSMNFSILVFTSLVIAQGRLNRATSSKLERPSIKVAKRTAWYAGAASCSAKDLDVWKCRSCQKARATMPSSVLPFASPVTEAAGYVLVDRPNRAVVLAFRGTNNFELGKLDLKYQQVPFADMGDKKVRVHQGFLEILDSLSPFFLPALSIAKNREYRVMVTGVSLGGAVASLASVRVHKKLKIPYSRITLITYGQPRTGNEAYARAFNRLPMKAARVVNNNDPFAHTPTSSRLGYTHHHNELFIPSQGKAHYCRTDILEDPKCSNSLPVLSYDAASHIQAWNSSFNPYFGC